MNGLRRLKFFLFIGLLLASIAISGNAMALTIRDVRVGLHPDKTRVVLELDEMRKFRIFVLSDPWRLVIDLPSFQWQAGTISTPVGSHIRSIRQGTLNRDISRIVVDLDRPALVKSAFLLRASEGRPDRLVIDFSAVSASEFAAGKGRIHGLLQEGEQPVANAPTPPSAIEWPSARGVVIPERKPFAAAPSPVPAPAPYVKPLVIIDPGHGGVDPGAIASNGLFEKHITLALARDLKRELENTGRYRVKLTRDSDTYLRLYQRVDVARAAGADLFVSIHADTIGKSNVRGASVYTLSDKASDEQTALLAMQENRADLIAGVDLEHEDEQVAGILVDLAMRDTMNQSRFFANTLVHTIGGDGIRLLENPHRYAGFAVLKAPDVPSVLVEAGFLSNRTEAELLSQPSYRRKIAYALRLGIDAYFEKVNRNKRI